MLPGKTQKLTRRYWPGWAARCCVPSLKSPTTCGKGQMAEETTIILCGGQINFTNLPVGSNLSNAMIPVNGKPVIGWILDDLLSKGFDAVVIVLRESNHRLAEFIQ